MPHGSASSRVAVWSGVRKFNTEGPVVAEDHYRIPPLGARRRATR